jgi:drug/metabolite transporter (DMT)-like permease
MNWLFLSFLTAICEASKDIFSKRSLLSSDVYIVAWVYRLFAIPFLLPIFWFIEIPTILPNFWWAILIGGGLNVLTTILYTKAIFHSDLSASVPMVAFTPLFLLITSPIIVGEFPKFMGLVGVILIVLGSYILHVKEIKNGLLSPFKALVKEKGPRYMLGVAFIWSVTSNIDKVGIMSSSSLFWAVSVNAFIALAMLPIVFIKSNRNLQQIRTNFRTLIPIGFFSAATLIFQMMAIELALVAYVISIKRTSAILVVIAGYWIFREKGVSYRLVAASIMVVGVLSISVF